MPELKDVVVVLDKRNRFLHVAGGDEYLVHAGVTKENADLSRVDKYEIYDSTGVLLMPDIAADGQPVLLPDPEGEPPNDVLLRDRIRAALMNIQVRIDRSDAPDFRVPVLDASLPVMLAALVQAYGPLHDPMAEAQGDHLDRLHNESHP